MRKLGIALLVVVLLAGLAQGILWWKVNNGVKTFAEQAAAMADVSYSGVYAWPWGAMGVHNLRVTPTAAFPGHLPGPVEAEGIGIELPPAIMRKLALGQSVNPDELQNFTLVIQGLGVDLDTFVPPSKPTQSGHSTDPCDFKLSDLPNRMLLDSRIDFHLDYAAKTFRTVGDYRLRNFIALDFDTTLRGIGAPTAAANMGSVELQSLTLGISDTGYQALVAKVCQEKGIPPAQLAKVVGDNLREALGAEGLELSENLLDAVQQFFAGSGNRLTFSTGMLSPIKFSELALYQAPNLLWGRLNPRIALNDKPIDNASIRLTAAAKQAEVTLEHSGAGPGEQNAAAMQAMPDIGSAESMPAPAVPQQPDASVSRVGPKPAQVAIAKQAVASISRADPAAAAPADPPGGKPEEAAAPPSAAPSQPKQTAAFQAIAMTNIGQYVGKRVRLTTQNNARFEGVLTEAQADRVKIRLNMHGGEVILPLQMQNITAAEIQQR